MSSARPIRITGVRGRVSQALYAKGTKSEREAVFIETNDGRYILRLKTGRAFGGTELAQYVGHEVKCDGFLIGTTLLAERIERIN